MVKWSRALISGQKLTNPSKCPLFYPWNLTKYPKSCSQMLREQIKPSKLIFWDRIKVDTDYESLTDSNMCSRSKFFGLNDFFLVKNWKEADLLKIKEKLGANLSKNATFQVTFWVLIWPARYKRIKTNIGAHKLSYLKLPSKSYLCYSEHTFWPWEQTDIMFGTDEVLNRKHGSRESPCIWDELNYFGPLLLLCVKRAFLHKWIIALLILSCLGSF